MVKIEEASSPSTHPWEYHVFLSFRGEDTRNNFTGHLCSALRQKGIITFMDDELRRGEEISTALVQAIEQSMISIIVLSKNYASSKWCLDELVKILECKESKQQMVRPVFYKVDPSDIRNHRGSFGESLANHERKFNGNLDKVQKWKKALSEAANLSGWPLLDEHHSESKLIGEIVEEISKQAIERTYLEVAKYPVGIEPRVQYVKELLSVEGREEVRMVGIWGIGGIGKTTIAKAVYNSISHNFDGGCFLENVRENSMQSSRGVVKLQQTLLSEILGGPKVKLTNASKGITMTKEFLRCKRVLLVLDDVNHLDQLNSLAGGSDWFGTGSRIIITTRDKKLLTAHNVNLVYKVNELDYHEAVELFSWNAFKRKGPLEDYVKLTNRAIDYARGLPLALRVLGSCLYGGNLDTWNATLDGFKSPEIQEILKVSYDALDVIVKQVFMDIACFFKGERTDYVIQVLKGCDLNPKYGINVLVEKALVNIDHDDCISMHDLLEEMGKDIVYQESPNDPGERSRLWFYDDVYHVLTENTGTSKITGIKVELPTDSDVICLSGTTFSQMRNLRLFIHRAGRFSGVLVYLPNSLKVVDWPDCPFQSLPSNFIPKNLALLHMPRSRITRIGEGFKSLKNLTSINLSHCEYLTEVSDLSGIPNLQTLDLRYCKNLVKVHHSVGLLDKLESVNLGGCSNLAILPTTVRWNSLRDLWLEDCTTLESFIEIVNKMQSIEQLYLHGSGIKELPSWIGYLSSLRGLDVSSSPVKELPSSIGGLTSLRELDVSCSPIKELPLTIGCVTSLTKLNLSGTPINELPSSIGGLTSLRELDVSNSPIKELPSSIGGLTSLTELYLSRTLITEFPSSTEDLTSLIILDVSETPIKNLPPSIGSLTSLTKLYLSGTLIKELPDSIGGLTSLRELYLSGTLIKELPSSIGGLTSLTELYLSGTLINDLPSTIGGLTSLTRLDVYGTLIEELPSSIGDLTSLTRLGMSETPIKELPSSIGGLISLKELYLSGTPIKELPSSLGGLTSLTLLYLSETLIIELPSSIGDLTSLIRLDVSETQIKKLPSSIGGLTSLTQLYLYGTPIKELPSSIGGLTSLTELYLSGTLITELPSSIGDLISLTKLDVSETPIKELPLSIGGLTCLTQFYLFGTPIKELPLSIGGLIYLGVVYLSGSLIKKLPSSIGYLTSLTELYLSGTLIEELPTSIGSLIGLKVLIVERSENLTNVPQSIYGAGLQCLWYLDLSWCPKLVTFPNRPVSSLVSSSAESLSSTPMLPTTSSASHDNFDSLLFPELNELHFKGCNLLSVSDFLSNLDCVSTLVRVDLSDSSFDSLPACISKFRRLQSINLSGCKWLRDISELPPNIPNIYLNDCISLEVLTLSNILEQKDAPLDRRMDLSNCNRLGIDVVSKIAKALPNQVVDGELSKAFEWHIKLPSRPRWEVPNWFHYREVDVCELLIEIPRSLIWGKIGLVVCVISEITQALSQIDSFSMDVMVDEIQIAHSKYDFFSSESSGCYAGLKYIGLDNLWKQQVDKKGDQSLPYIFRVRTFMESDKPFLLKSCGLNLANMPGNDDDDEGMPGDDDDVVVEEENYDDDDDDDAARGEELEKRESHIGRATLAFLRCFGITCL